MTGRHRNLSDAPSRSARGAARRLKRRLRAAVALQATLLAACLVGTGLSARDETPATALAGMAERIHWRKDEERALALLQRPPRTTHHHLSRRRKNKMIAMSMLARFDWPKGRQFPCLERLWERESGWNHHSANGAGAYGIPQALPGRKMRSAGADWRTNPETQIRWGLRYIKYRYGSPCRAWAHSMATGWY